MILPPAGDIRISWKNGKIHLVHRFWCFWLTVWTGWTGPVQQLYFWQRGRCPKKVSCVSENETGGRTMQSPTRLFQMSINIYSSSQTFLRRAIDTVIWVCHSRDLLGGKSTSAVSEVLSCEISDLIKSPPSHWLLPHLPHLYGTWHLFTSPIHHAIWLFFSLTFLYNLSHPYHTFASSPRLPLLGPEVRNPAILFWNLLLYTNGIKPGAQSDLRRKHRPNRRLWSMQSRAEYEPNIWQNSLPQRWANRGPGATRGPMNCLIQPAEPSQ